MRRALLGVGPIGRALVRADLAIYRVARTCCHAPGIERAVRIYSGAGQHAAVWLAVGLAGAAFDGPRRRGWWRGAMVVAVSYILNTAIKLVVRRRRPAFEDLPALISTPTQLSFPSAHATSSFAAARVYSGLLPGAILYPAATAMAASRVYLGVHYPTDIVAGAALGTFVGGLAR